MRSSRLVRLAFCVLLVPLLFHSCGGEVLDAVDPAESPAAILLREYIRVDTSNPPGNETRGAEWLGGHLRSAGIEYRLLGTDRSRQSLYARLDAPGDAPALLLMHHIDVVPADPDQWTVDPFGAEIRGGYVWGRGAIDAKSLGVAHLLSFLSLAEARERLNRDVILLAVADEETGGLDGLAALLADHPKLFEDVGFVLNEGGGNQVVVDKVIFWGIEVDQKVPLWVEVIAEGRGGHGSGMHGDSSVMRLLRVLDRVRRVEPQRVIQPSVREYFKSISRVKEGQRAEVLAQIDRYIGSARLDSVLAEGYLGLLQDTWTISVLDAGDRVNVVPNRARAAIDIRLPPGSDPEKTLEHVMALADGDAEVNVLLMGEPAPPSPTDTELWQVLERVLSEGVVGPMVSLGATDSRFFRDMGVVAYGFSPFKVNYYDVATVHGADERIRLSFLNEGVETMKEIVAGFCLARP